MVLAAFRRIRASKSKFTKLNQNFNPESTFTIKRSYLPLVSIEARVIASLLVVFLSYFLRVYFVPFFSLELKHKFKIPESEIGPFFMALSFVGIITATPGILILRQCFQLSSIMVIGVIFALIGNTVMGLCPLLWIPHEISFIWIGIILLGISLILLDVTFIPYIILHYERQHPLELEGLGSLSP